MNYPCFCVCVCVCVCVYMCVFVYAISHVGKSHKNSQEYVRVIFYLKIKRKKWEIK